MKKIIGRSLKTKLIMLFFLVSIIPLVILGSVSYYIMSNNILKEYDKRVSLQVVAEVGNYDEWFGEIESMVYSVSTSQYAQKYLANNGGEKERYEQILILTSRIDSLINTGSNKVDTFMFLPLNKAGYPIFKGDYILGKTSVYKTLPIIQKVLKNKNSLVWGVMDNNAKTSKYIVAAQAVWDQFSEEVIGVTIIGFNSKQLGNVSEKIIANENESIFVLDENYGVLFETKKNVAQKFFTESMKDKMEKDSLEESYSLEVDGIKYRLFVSSTRINGLKIFFSMPEKNMLGNMNYLPQLIICILAICCIFATGLAFYVYWDVYGPIKKLSYAMNKFNNDTAYIQVDIKRKDELGILADCFNTLIIRIEELIIDVEEEAKQKKDFEIRALQAQITPHFLYNTLNNIKAMARIGRTEDISKMTTALIRLLYVSANQVTDFITLVEEMQYLDAYIQIMQYRFEQSLTLKFDVEEEIKQSYILRFLLQPILENAVIHGFKDKMEEPCKITVHAYREDEHLIIEIMDNGGGMPENIQELLNNYTEEKDKFSRIGIKNIEERIQLNFGKEYGLHYDSKIGIGTKVVVALPYIDKLVH
jgi:sensor histidine kinase YesM